VHHKWVESLSHFGVKKVRVYNKSLYETDTNLKKVLSLGGDKTPPYPECLVTYMGFGFNPSGLFFRSLEEKLFHCEEFIKRKLIYYVSENFEKNLGSFKFGMPIILLEGILDVEACSYFVNYPFVLGYMTSHIRENLAALFSTLSNNFLIIPDNDGTELIKKCTSKSIKNMNKFGVQPEVLNIESKDFGDVFYSKNQVDINKVKYSLEQYLLNTVTE
jgi:hypothetical protein